MEYEQMIFREALEELAEMHDTGIETMIWYDDRGMTIRRALEMEGTASDKDIRFNLSVNGRGISLLGVELPIVLVMEEGE